MKKAPNNREPKQAEKQQDSASTADYNLHKYAIHWRGAERITTHKPVKP